MKTLVAILCPPVAVLFTGRPISALLNVVLTLFFWIPGIIHALIVQNADANERRHAEMMSAVTGQVIKPRVSGEKQLVTAVLLLMVILGAVSVVISAVAPVQSTAETVPPPAPAPTPAPTLPQQGEAYQAIAAQHGEAQEKDRSTGWATWPHFRARFVDGKAVEVQPK